MAMGNGEVSGGEEDEEEEGKKEKGGEGADSEVDIFACLTSTYEPKIDETRDSR
jgi:hypothetical protein